MVFIGVHYVHQLGASHTPILSPIQRIHSVCILSEGFVQIPES